MDGAAPATAPADLERRAVWLAVAAGLILVLRTGSTISLGLSQGHLHRQLWLYIVGTAALGAATLLAGLVALPEMLAYPSRVATRWNPVRLFGWAFALFVVGVLITAIALIAAAADALTRSPFGA